MATLTITPPDDGQDRFEGLVLYSPPRHLSSDRACVNRTPIGACNESRQCPIDL